MGPDRRGGGDILRDSGGVRLPSSGGLSGGSFSMVAWEGAGLRHHPSAVRDRHLLIEVCVLFSRTVSLSHQEDLRIRGGPCLEGYSAGSWRRSPWTTYVPLDHLRAVGPPYFVNQVVQRNASGPTARKWSKRAGRVTTCETPSRHARRSSGAGAGAPEPPPTTGPPVPPRPRLPHPSAPGGDSGGSSRPAPRPDALDGPSHHPRGTPSEPPPGQPS